MEIIPNPAVGRVMRVCQSMTGLYNWPARREFPFSRFSGMRFSQSEYNWTQVQLR
jgi:hypothetical protein